MKLRQALKLWDTTKRKEKYMHPMTKCEKDYLPWMETPSRLKALYIIERHIKRRYKQSHVKL